MNNIGVIGDIHGQSNLLQKSINFLQSKNLEIYCTGDIPGKGPEIDECVNILMNNNIPTIKGNHDDWLQKGQCSDSSFEYIKNLPYTMTKKTERGNILFCHGIGENYMKKINPDDYGYAIESNYELHTVIDSKKYYLMINGHSHKKMARTINGFHIINAGALVHNPGFIIVDPIHLHIEFYVFNNFEIQLENTVQLC